MFKTYCPLTKLGIIYGMLTAAAGICWFQNSISIVSYLQPPPAGTSPVIASARVVTTIQDRDIDQHGTYEGASVGAGLISGKAAIIYANSLGLTGFFNFSGRYEMCRSVGTGASIY